MLNADTSVPNVYGSLGTFGDILQRVLAAAASQAYGAAGPAIHHSVYNTVAGEYPESLDDVDAIIITASAASTYDEQRWIQKLEAFVVMLYTQHPRIKMFGSCFGHHLICQALLKDHGLRVEKHPRGWEIGISEVVFSDDFRETFARSCGTKEDGRSFSTRSIGRLPTPDEDEDDDSGELGYFGAMASPGVPPSARLQFVHADEVVSASVLPELAPPGWILVGSTEHCAVQGVYQAGRVLTLQGHFEFDKFEDRQTMEIFGADGHASVDADASTEDPRIATGNPRRAEQDDGEVVAEMVVRFLVEGNSSSPGTAGQGTRGNRTQRARMRLPTPRASTETL